jgi:hypothetical protein
VETEGATLSEFDELNSFEGSTANGKLFGEVYDSNFRTASNFMHELNTVNVGDLGSLGFPNKLYFDSTTSRLHNQVSDIPPQQQGNQVFHTPPQQQGNQLSDTAPQQQGNQLSDTPPQQRGNQLFDTPPQQQGNQVSDIPPQQQGNQVSDTPPQQQGNQVSDTPPPQDLRSLLERLRASDSMSRFSTNGGVDNTRTGFLRFRSPRDNGEDETIARDARFFGYNGIERQTAALNRLAEIAQRGGYTASMEDMERLVNKYNQYNVNRGNRIQLEEHVINNYNKDDRLESSSKHYIVSWTNTQGRTIQVTVPAWSRRH